MTDRRSAVSKAHAQAQRERWALALAGPDRELLEMQKTLTYSQLAVRLGISRSGVNDRLANARRRETIREAMAARIN